MNANRPVIMVGYVSVAIESLSQFLPDNSVIVIDEPDVIESRGVREHLQGKTVVRDLIEWEFQLPGAADAFANAHPDLDVQAVAPLQEYATPFAARLAERWRLPGATFGAAAIFRDKALLRKASAAAGIANPASREVDSPAGIAEFVAEYPGTVVVKPANRQAALGTTIVRPGDDINAAWDACAGAEEGIMVPQRGFPLRVLVEQFVEGAEYSVEALVHQGKMVFHNVTGKDLVEGPHPVELGHTAPADISESLRDRLFAETQRVLEAVDFQTGVIHCEWIVSGDTPFLVECAGRFAGDGIIELIERAYEFPMVEAFWTLMRDLPWEKEFPREPVQAASVRFLVRDPGKVVSVSGVKEAAELPGVTSLHVGVKAGDTVKPLSSSWDRIGSVIALGSNPAEAEKHAQAALDAVKLKME